MRSAKDTITRAAYDFAVRYTRMLPKVKENTTVKNEALEALRKPEDATAVENQR